MKFQDFKREMYIKGFDYLDLFDATVNFVESHWNKQLYVKFHALTGVFEDGNKLSKARYSIREVLCTMFDYFLKSLNLRCNSLIPLEVGWPLFLNSIWHLLKLDESCYNDDLLKVLNNSRKD